MHVSRHANRNDSLIKALKIEIIWLQSLVYGTPEGHFFLSNTFHLYTTDSLDVKGFFIYFLFLFFFPGEIIFPTLTCSLKATAEQYVGELISSLAVLALM